MLTVFFAANAAEANAVVESGTLDPAAALLPSVDTGGVSPMALVTLDASITGAEPGAIVDDVLHEPLANLRNGEQLLFRVRPALTAALTRVGDLEQAAANWAATDEMVADGYSAADCLSVMQGLAALAAEAETTERVLYTWLCV